MKPMSDAGGTTVTKEQLGNVLKTNESVRSE
jgi:hypothetical protein